MGRIIVTEFVSLDGVFENPHEWHFPFFLEQAQQYKADELRGTDALLLGRRTWQIWAAFWPTVSSDSSPIAARLNAIPKYVVSKTLARAEWSNSVILAGEIAEEVAVYNELVPGPHELSATLMIEIPDRARIRPELDRLVGIDEHVFLDVGGATVQASMTSPQFFVLDRDRTITYMGALDDSTDADKVTEHYLDDALRATLAGRSPEVPETIARGCRIRYETERQRRRRTRSND